MDVPPRDVLRGQLILIVENNSSLVSELIRVLEEQEGAQVVYVTDPLSEVGAKRIKQFQWCAAIINSAHRGVAGALAVPVLIYGAHASVPAEAAAVVQALKTMLAPHD